MAAVWAEGNIQYSPANTSSSHRRFRGLHKGLGLPPHADIRWRPAFYLEIPTGRADFLANFKMVVDLSSMQLLCPAGLKIPLEAPRSGSLTAAAIGVLDSPSALSLPTVEALSSTPTLPTEGALEASGSSTT